MRLELDRVLFGDLGPLSGQIERGELIQLVEPIGWVDYKMLNRFIVFLMFYTRFNSDLVMFFCWFPNIPKSVLGVFLVTVNLGQSIQILLSIVVCLIYDI